MKPFFPWLIELLVCARVVVIAVVVVVVVIVVYDVV